MSDIDEGDRVGDRAHSGIDQWRNFKNHKYGFTRHGRPATCIRCGVQRRSTKDRNGKMRRLDVGVVPEKPGRWQYRSPCSKSWQYTRISCYTPKEPK